MKVFLGIFPASLILSVAIHLFVGGYLHFQMPEEAPQKERVVEIEYIKASEEKTEQIVQQDKRINDKTPSKEAFLGKFNQSVDEQMRASKSGKTKDTAGGGSFFPAQTKKTVKKQAKAKSKSYSKDAWKKVSLADLKPKFDFAPDDANKNQQAFVGEESQSNDYLEKVKRGNENLLNTREFRYYTYFNRIRDQLQQFWEPSVRDRLYKLVRSGRSIASAGPRTTKVLITLNKLGNLMKVQVLEDSGLRDLDEAAVDAFREAAPFPNPPQGIVEKDGTVKIRWDFVLEA